MVGSVLDFTFHQTIFQILFIHTNPFSPAQIPIRYPLKQGKLFHFFLHMLSSHVIIKIQELLVFS